MVGRSDALAVDPDDVDPATLTLCVDCAKHPGLKAFVKTNSITGLTCGICLRASQPYEACDLSKFDALKYAIRSLIRFYYDEFEYNTHWGADEDPDSLLVSENPILEHVHTLFHYRNPATSYPFLESIFDNPYPPRSEGVAVYAGFDENGTRYLARSIQKQESKTLREFRNRLLRENYYRLEPELRDLFRLLGARIENHIEVGAQYYRARIGFESRYARHSMGFENDIHFKPYEGKNLGAPPPLSAGPGRLNRAGVSALYLSSNPHTAAAEVRPHPSHRLSIGAFSCNRRLKIANFDADIIQFSSNDEELDLFDFVYSTDVAMSLPILPEDSNRYSITQLIADVARQDGYDGLAFKSSLSDGQNICIFDTSSFDYIDASSRVRRVSSLQYSMDDEGTIHTLTPDDYKID